MEINVDTVRVLACLPPQNKPGFMGDGAVVQEIAEDLGLTPTQVRASLEEIRERFGLSECMVPTGPYGKKSRYALPRKSYRPVKQFLNTPECKAVLAGE